MADHSDPLKARGYTVITVGVGLAQLQKGATDAKKMKVMMRDLREIASKDDHGKPMMFVAQRFNQLVPMMKKISEQTCVTSKTGLLFWRL